MRNKIIYLLKRREGIFLALLFISGIAGCNKQSASPSHEEVSIQVRLEPEKISMDATTRLTVHLESKGGESLENPGWREPEGVRVVGRSTSTRIQYVNGVKSTILDLSLVLQPLKEGTITLPAFEVKTSDGKIHRSRELSLQVSKGTGQPPVPQEGPERDGFPRRNAPPPSAPGQVKNEVMI